MAAVGLTDLVPGSRFPIPYCTQAENREFGAVSRPGRPACRGHGTAHRRVGNPDDNWPLALVWALLEPMGMLTVLAFGIVFAGLARLATPDRSES